MANMLDYILWRGDLSFRERPLNEVDNLIFCEFGYAKWDGLLPDEGSGEVLFLRDAAIRYVASGRPAPPSTDPGPALRLGALSARFSGAGVSDFVNRVDRANHIQFCALTFHPGDGSLFVAFRGTDSTLTGWREDFSLSYSVRTPAQEAAVRYLEDIAARYPGPIRVGGHSKGGNLALYAASFCNDAVRARIADVYSNDGPGLNEKAVDTPDYVPLSGCFHLIIPEESVIGVIMNDGTERRVIKSSARGLQQHDPMTWQVLGSAFEEAGGQTGSSVFVDRTVRRWLDDMSDSERQSLTDALFDGMEATGADTLRDVKSGGLAAAGTMLKNFFDMDGTRQKEVVDSVGKLVRAGGGQLVDGARKGIGGLMNIIDQTLSRSEDKENKPPENK